MNSLIDFAVNWLKKKPVQKKKKKKPVVTPTPVRNIAQNIPQTPTEQNKTGKSGGPSQPQVLRDSKTGQLSGITINGKTYLGLSPEDVRKMAAAQQQKMATPPGAVEASDIAKQQASMQERQNLIQNLGKLTPEQIAQAQTEAQRQVGAGGLLPENINLKQAATAGASEAAIGASAGAIGGAGLGALAGGVGAIPGAVAGAAIGSVGAFIKGAYADIKQQQSGQVRAEQQSVIKAITNLNNIVSAVNQGADPEEAQILYNQQVAQVYKSWSELKLQTQGTASAFDDGTKELAQFEIFFDPNGGILSTINLKMAQAIANPNPSKIEASTLQAYQEEK